MRWYWFGFVFSVTSLVICVNSAKLNVDLTAILLDRAFKTLEFLNKTYNEVEERIEKLDLFFSRCTNDNYRKSLDEKIQNMHVDIGKKYEEHLNPDNPNQMDCVKTSKEDVEKSVANSTKTFNDCMSRKQMRIMKAKHTILNEIKDQEYNVQEKVCGLMECKDDTCLVIKADQTLALLSQAIHNSTQLPIRGFQRFIDEYRTQYEHCKSTTDENLENQFVENNNDLHICLIGVDNRNKEVKM